MEVRLKFELVIEETQKRQRNKIIDQKLCEFGSAVVSWNLFHDPFFFLANSNGKIMLNRTIWVK